MVVTVQQCRYLGCQKKTSRLFATTSTSTQSWIKLIMFFHWEQPALELQNFSLHLCHCNESPHFHEEGVESNPIYPFASRYTYINIYIYIYINIWEYIHTCIMFLQVARKPVPSFGFLQICVNTYKQDSLACAVFRTPAVSAAGTRRVRSFKRSFAKKNHQVFKACILWACGVAIVVS